MIFGIRTSLFFVVDALIISMLILTSMSAPTRRDIAKSICDTVLPHPNSVDYIQPSVEVFDQYHDSDVISNDVSRSANTIISYLPWISAERIIFITHGFKGNIANDWLYEMKDAILDNDDNQMVVLVGWEKGAAMSNLPTYLRAVVNTQVVGKFIGQIAEKVMKTRFRSSVSLYGIGHSLGSHVMGAAGRYSRSRGFPFSRITGLDPAGPAFESCNHDKRLSANDADFVDVIHTDGNTHYAYVPLDYFGTLIPLGHLDFYPNWGKPIQPGCTFTSPFIDHCNHHKAINYFKVSIANEGKFKTKCTLQKEPKWNEIDEKLGNTDTCTEMGYFADTAANKKGWYYINITEEYNVISCRGTTAHQKYSVELFCVLLCSVCFQINRYFMV